MGPSVSRRDDKLESVSTLSTDDKAGGLKVVVEAERLCIDELTNLTIG